MVVENWSWKIDEDGFIGLLLLPSFCVTKRIQQPLNLYVGPRLREAKAPVM